MLKRAQTSRQRPDTPRACARAHTPPHHVHGSQARRRCTAPHASGAPVLSLVPHTFQAPSALPWRSTSASSTLGSNPSEQRGPGVHGSSQDKQGASDQPSKPG